MQINQSRILVLTKYFNEMSKFTEKNKIKTELAY